MSDAAPWEDYAPAASKPAAANDTGPWNDYAPPKAPERVGWAEENLAGPTEVIASTVANIPHAAAHAAVDLYRRITGGNTDAPDPAAVQAIQVPMGAGGQQLLSDAKALLPARSTDNSATDETRIPEFSPGTQDIIRNAVQVGGDVGNIAPLVGAVKGGVSALADAAVTRAPTVTEAAQAVANKAAAAPIDASKLTPETQAELAKVKNADPVALARHHDAETLPVPVRLTEGQATGNAATISDEFNRKGRENNAIGNRYNEQDEALQENLSTIHREAAPTAVGNDEIQNGQSVIDSLKRYDAPKVQEINTAYKAAKDANGGDLQMDGSKFVDTAEAAIKQQGRARFLPSSVRGILDDVKAADGKMSLDDFEGNRTALANEMRKAQQSGDGNAVAAINKVRDALEATPPADGTSAAAKGLYDKARGLAKARFDEMKADPAYDAAVSDPTPVGRLSPDADKFAGKYILNGAKADLQQLRPKLDQEGGEAMTSTAMNYLKKQAGLDRGKFLQNGYNTALNKIAPKADELIGSKETHEQLQQLGRVGNYTQAQTRGGYANNSHTFVAAAKEHAAGYIQDLGNSAVPFAKLGDKAAQLLDAHQSAKAAYESLKPGAGLEKR
jgi:hypothetical protein